MNLRRYAGGDCGVRYATQTPINSGLRRVASRQRTPVRNASSNLLCVCVGISVAQETDTYRVRHHQQQHQQPQPQKCVRSVKHSAKPAKHLTRHINLFADSYLSNYSTVCVWRWRIYEPNYCDFSASVQTRAHRCCVHNILMDPGRNWSAPCADPFGANIYAHNWFSLSIRRAFAQCAFVWCITLYLLYLFTVSVGKASGRSAQHIRVINICSMQTHVNASVRYMYTYTHWLLAYDEAQGVCEFPIVISPLVIY